MEFDGKTYICRIVDSIDGEELLIGSTELLDALQPGSFEDVNEGFASKEAEDLYDEVFYFTEPQNLLLPDKELIEVLKESNPDWFEWFGNKHRLGASFLCSRQFYPPCTITYLYRTSIFDCCFRQKGV